jgi:hypothetical protein
VQVVVDASKHFSYPRDVRPDTGNGQNAPPPHKEVEGVPSNGSICTALTLLPPCARLQATHSTGSA